MTDDVLFRALVEQARDHAIFLIDPAGCNLTWGAGVERLLGYGRDEFIGSHTRDIFTAEDRDAGVPERELGFARAHGAASDERWLLRKDGSRFWASGMTYRLLDAAGSHTGFAKVFRDLTVEREFDQELRQSAERYRLAVRAADEVLWDRDLNTDTVNWTDGFQEVFGYASSEVGKDVRWLEARIHPEDRARVTQSMQRAIAGRVDRWEETYRFRRSDGEYALVHDRALIMRSTDGVPLRMLGAMSDVDRLERGREALRHAQRLEALGRLAGGVAHELNNMLMAIIGYTELLDRGLSRDDPGHGHTAEVLTAAKRSAVLTRRLLAFARREISRPVRADVNEVIAGAVGALRALVGSDIELTVDLAPGLPRVQVDPGQLDQILSDLVLNGRDAMPDGGLLTIETGERRLHEADIHARYPGVSIAPGAYVAVAVSDSGSGMSPEVLERVFEPFFTTRPMGQGMGLGLAAVYGAVKQNNGYIWAESAPGKGTRWDMLFPAAELLAAAD